MNDDYTVGCVILGRTTKEKDLMVTCSVDIKG